MERSNNYSREKYPQSKLYRSFDELLNDEAIDLIVVNTPVQTHYDFAKKALLHKKMYWLKNHLPQMATKPKNSIN